MPLLVPSHLSMGTSTSMAGRLPPSGTSGYRLFVRRTTIKRLLGLLAEVLRYMQRNPRDSQRSGGAMRSAFHHLSLSSSESWNPDFALGNFLVFRIVTIIVEVKAPIVAVLRLSHLSYNSAVCRIGAIVLGAKSAKRYNQSSATEGSPPHLCS